ncbi:MAG: DUF4957 domain-containing protein [Candidatus Pedobacter colombiensis]|uniref:DUF4957 domain-containing protein n=1 Tax=Candidatus Pedobacter colombiensis TaxID=3121371 RepID=A0AAJ5W704_9SPHI|nr:DUF4957 domain-containing protein [Pedobacter sp.]WEK17712.1 MAG: DUF4957 domain-containing protein [Pedobacter sp.]
MKFNTYKTLLALMLLTAFTACKKAPGPVMNYYVDAPKNMRLNAVKTTLHATWEYSGKENVGFLAQVAYDANFSTIIKSDTLASTATAVDFTNLSYFSEAYVRVRALSSNLILHSNFVAATIKPESILKTILKSELTATSAILRWNAPSSGTLTSVLILDNLKKTERTIQLSTQNISSQSLLIDGLESAGNYTAVIFAGEDRKGVLTFNAVDLKMSITIQGSTEIYETLHEAVAAAPAGGIINIGGAKYDFSTLGTVEITKAVTIRAVQGGDIPEITSQAFNIVGNVASLTLSGLKIAGKSSYAIIATGLTSACSIVVENCEVTGPTAGLVYVAATAVAAANVNFRMNNSVCRDFGATGGDFIDFRAGGLSGMTITNSTFYNLARDFFRIDATTTYPISNPPILVENCTFNNVCGYGTNGTQGRFIYIRVAKVTGYTMMKINKCILTNKFRSLASGVNPTIEFTNNNVFGNYSTEWAGGTVSNAVTTLDPQYADVVKFNFTVGNATVKAAGLGDPRWLK